MFHSKITGLGFYVPPNVVTNDDLSKKIDTNDAWIQERTGIQERRHIIKGEDTTTTMGVKAAEIAIEKKFDYVICGHIHKPQMKEVANENGKVMYFV